MEALRYPGKANILLTGHIGDVAGRVCVHMEDVRISVESDVGGQDVERPDGPVASEASKDVSGWVLERMCAGGSKEAGDESEGSKEVMHGVLLLGVRDEGNCALAEHGRHGG